jgi:hypothetical protein
MVDWQWYAMAKYRKIFLCAMQHEILFAILKRSLILAARQHDMRFALHCNMSGRRHVGIEPTP